MCQLRKCNDRGHFPNENNFKIIFFLSRKAAPNCIVKLTNSVKRLLNFQRFQLKIEPVHFILFVYFHPRLNSDYNKKYSSCEIYKRPAIKKPIQPRSLYRCVRSRNVQIQPGGLYRCARSRKAHGF